MFNIKIWALVMRRNTRGRIQQCKHINTQHYITMVAMSEIRVSTYSVMVFFWGIVCSKKYIHTIFPFSESIFHHAPNYMYTTVLYLPLEAEMNVLIARDLKSVEWSSRLHGHLLLPREKNLAQGACKKPRSIPPLGEEERTAPAVDSQMLTMCQRGWLLTN